MFKFFITYFIFVIHICILAQEPSSQSKSNLGNMFASFVNVIPDSTVEKIPELKYLRDIEEGILETFFDRGLLVIPGYHSYDESQLPMSLQSNYILAEEQGFDVFLLIQPSVSGLVVSLFNYRTQSVVYTQNYDWHAIAEETVSPTSFRHFGNEIVSKLLEF